jgi:RNA polymerase sigma-70 factor, ECF subfamily
MLRAFPTALMLRAVAPGTGSAGTTGTASGVGGSGGGSGGQAGQGGAGRAVTLDRHARTRWLVEEHIEFVTRTLRSAGVPPADLDDEVQRTFIVAARRLDDLQPGAERAFLGQVALNLAWHARRSLARRREIPSDQMPEMVETRATPEELIDRMQIRQHLDGIIDRMDESLRAVFKLFVIDEMNLGEIAQLLSVPRGTVASRLRRAREQLRRQVDAVDLAWTLGAKGVKRIDEPVSIWHKKLGAVERALLRVGACFPAWPRTRAKTLAGLGLA